MEDVVISGIQQMGIGVANMPEAWSWYRKVFGVDIKVFEEAAEAKLMLPYTGGEPRSRHAALAINLQGGGGFEIWQYTSRTPEPPTIPIELGDLGLFACKIKCPVDIWWRLPNFCFAKQNQTSGGCLNEVPTEG